MMATHDAIRSLGDAVLALMREACPLAELELAPGTPFDAATPRLFAAATAPADGFYLLLWRVAISGSPRSLPPRRRPDGTLGGPPLPVDLQYLLLPVAADAQRQARMLGWVLRFMHDLPVLGGALLNRYARGAPAFGDDESVEFIADALPAADHLVVWDRLKAGFHPFMAYTARMVLIESARVESTGAPVTERVFELTKGPR